MDGGGDAIGTSGSPLLRHHPSAIRLLAPQRPSIVVAASPVAAAAPQGWRRRPPAAPCRRSTIMRGDALPAAWLPSLSNDGGALRRHAVVRCCCWRAPNKSTHSVDRLASRSALAYCCSAAVRLCSLCPRPGLLLPPSEDDESQAPVTFTDDPPCCCCYVSTCG